MRARRRQIATWYHSIDGGEIGRLRQLGKKPLDDTCRCDTMTTCVVSTATIKEPDVMARPEGTLTAAQHEILEVVWNSAPSGATVTEIWQAIAQRRKVTRTTVLNQVDRLEKRNWLARRKSRDGFRYWAVRTREQAARSLTEEFVDSFFGGSAADLVVSLLGSKRLKPTEVRRLRELLDARSSTRKPKE